MRTLSRFSIELPAASRRWLGSSAPLSCPRQYGLKLGGHVPVNLTRNVDSTRCSINNGMGQSVRSSIITLWWINQLLSWSNPYMKGSKDPKFTEFQCLISFRFLWCFVKFLWAKHRCIVWAKFSKRRGALRYLLHSRYAPRSRPFLNTKLIPKMRLWGIFQRYKFSLFSHPLFCNVPIWQFCLDSNSQTRLHPTTILTLALLLDEHPPSCRFALRLHCPKQLASNKRFRFEIASLSECCQKPILSDRRRDRHTLKKLGDNKVFVTVTKWLKWL